jgi:ribonuclease HII
MARIPLSEIKRRYMLNGKPLDAATEAALRADPRAGARTILMAIEQRRFDNRAEGQRLRHLLRYEWALWDKGGGGGSCRLPARRAHSGRR